MPTCCERELDDRMRQLHNKDRERANVLLNYLVDLPPKPEALRVIIDLLETVRGEGADEPLLTHELYRRRRARAAEKRAHTVKESA